MANCRRRRNNARVSSAARQGSKTQQKNLMKYGSGSVASIVVVAAIVFAVASSSGGGVCGNIGILPQRLTFEEILLIGDHVDALGIDDWFTAAVAGNEAQAYG